MRNYREEIEIALSGGIPGVVPLTIYTDLIPNGIDPSPLQSMGLSIAARRNVYREVIKDVTVEQTDEGDGRMRTVYKTPVGTLTELGQQAGYGARSPLERPIKTKDDYKIAEFIVKNTRYEPAYDDFLAERRSIADTGYAYGHTYYSPLVNIQIRWLGQERFCYELADNEDAVMSLYEVLAANHRQMYEVVARSPAKYCLYGGNIVPEMIGPERIRRFVLPCWQEFGAIMNEEGKKLGVHLDADNRAIIDIITESSLYFLEAFTPPPDCSISVKEARELWPEKVLWVNFPSSLHLFADSVIRQATLEILEQAGDRRGFLMGITEDIPREHFYRSLSIILDTISTHCKLH